VSRTAVRGWARRLRRGVVASGLLLPARLGAQFPAPDSAPPPIIQAMELHREDLFDSSETIHWYARWLNSVHVVTRPWVIRRELLFKPGQPWDSALVAESARNLRQLGHFRSVEIDSIPTDTGLLVRTTTRDGWTTRLSVGIRTTGSQVGWSFSLYDSNTLGTGIAGLIGYRQIPDRNILQLGVAAPRLLFNRIGVRGQYQALSDGQDASASIGEPFLSQASRFSFRVGWRYFQGRILQFFDGNPVPLDTLQRRFYVVSGDLAHAVATDKHGYFRAGLAGDIQRDGYRPGLPGPPIPQATSGTIGPYVEVSRARFEIFRGFESFDRPEDIDLSPSVRFAVFAAPTTFGYSMGGVGPAIFLEGGTTILDHHGFATAHLIAGGLMTDAGLDSGTTIGTVMAAARYGRHLGVVYASGGLEKGAPPGAEFDLGFSYGPRAFAAHSFTGDRYYFATAEYRVMVTPALFGLFGIGVAAFGDVGGAWYLGSPSRSGGDVGAGLRMGVTRQAELSLLRLDLAYRMPQPGLAGGWVFAIGKGFVFQSRE
jgi:hypothetical protein